jgi:hypothetical protein
VKACGLLSKTLLLSFLPFHHPMKVQIITCSSLINLFLILIELQLMSLGPLEVQTQAPPCLSLSSIGMAMSCSSLSDMPAVLMIRAGSFFDVQVKLHLQ